jgi:outer membrane protein
MRFTKLAVALALLAGAGTSAFGADLLQVFRDAQVQDPTLGAARSQWAATQEAVPQARAGLLPNVNLAANTQYNDVDFTIRGDQGSGSATRRYNSNGAGVSASQPLFRAQNYLAYKEAQVQVTQADFVLASAQIDLIQRVAQAYFDVLLAQDNVTLAGAQKAAISENLAQAKRNFEVGTATITDTNDAQARYDQTVALEISAQNDLEIRRRALQAIIGTLPEYLKPLRDAIPLGTPEPTNIDDWAARAERQNFAVLTSQAALDIAEHEIDRNRAAHLPTVDVVASYNDQSAGAVSVNLGPPTPFTQKTTVIGVQLNMPLYTGGLVNSRVRQALSLRDQARQNLELNRRTAAQTARTAYLGVVNGVAQVKALEQAVVSAQTALDSAQLGMEVGVRTNLDVLNSTQQLYSARRDLYQARYNYLLSTLRLRGAVGELSDEHVEQINRLLSNG